MNSEVNDAPRAACAADRPVRSDRLQAVTTGLTDRLKAVTTNVELTPRGLELLEALNELFDTLAGPSSVAGRALWQPHTADDRPRTTDN